MNIRVKTTQHRLRRLRGAAAATVVLAAAAVTACGPDQPNGSGKPIDPEPAGKPIQPVPGVGHHSGGHTNYTITLEVWNDDGESDTATTMVRVFVPPEA